MCNKFRFVIMCTLGVLCFLKLVRNIREVYQVSFIVYSLIGPNFHLHMRQLRHLHMPTSLTHASDSATSHAHAPTFPSRFAHARFGVSGWGFGVGS